ncbi:4-hydroxybenzoyl-CoA thioesterase [Stutzerimonas stutzeri]|uniref:4-hydroxybenzoyl-CoA thioesterase n=1 Tax=Stutzerimonas stutzeri TaxID=316 RepID=W8RQC5_STUST|nr:thioesterase family protein [Stutzerimonas stutzeri]AHL74241.1 4-hydroxybenzoyl-CoA thioesterase [Stutzerimonas stutzeri]MCQ4331385.1 thioesterase family protein [Stutzerimonas stutzeri]
MLLTSYRTAVPAEWVDYNDHLRDAFYLLIFSYATDALMDRIGLDEPGRTRTGHTLYTLECHINYLNEVKRGSEVEVRTHLLAYDRKRLHVHLGLYRPDEEQLLAASEQMLMNIDRRVGRSAPFDEAVLAQVQGLYETQRDLPRPIHIGRVIGLPG